jgi:hypothetical protein
MLGFSKGVDSISQDIVVQTRKANNITNNQCHESSAFEKNQFPEYEKKYPRVTYRTPPIPIYNCHGLTFASRRTRIFRSEEVRKILLDDGYSEIEKDKVKPGDIIIYYAEDGDVEHSGLVVSEPDKYFRIPSVVSKWGSYREVIHVANDCPYTFVNVKYYRVIT